MKQRDLYRVLAQSSSPNVSCHVFLVPISWIAIPLDLSCLVYLPQLCCACACTGIGMGAGRWERAFIMIVCELKYMLEC